MKRKITPHKGGRTERVYIRVTPKTKALAEQLARATNKTIADLFEQWVNEKAPE